MMNLQLALSALLFCLPVMAQESITPTPTEKVWIVLSSIAMSNDEDAAAHLQYHGMSEEGTEPLLRYVRAGLRNLENIGTQWAADLCARGAEFINDPERFAQEVERHEAEYNAAREQFADGARAVLNPDDQRALDDLVQHMGSHIAGVKTDVPGAIRRGEVVPSEAISDACHPDDEDVGGGQ